MSSVCECKKFIILCFLVALINASLNLSSHYTPQERWKIVFFCQFFAYSAFTYEYDSYDSVLWDGNVGQLHQLTYCKFLPPKTVQHRSVIMHHAEVVGGRGLDNTQWESVLVVGRQQCAQLGIFGKTLFCQYLPQNTINLKSIKSAEIHSSELIKHTSDW